MLVIDVRGDVSAIARQLDAQQKRIPIATAIALTKTAVKVREALYAEMRQVFDRPTPYTLNSLYLKPATPARLQARVWLKDDTFKGTPATKYLDPQIRGGDRNLKRFERALRAIGALPPGWFAVPGSGAVLDAFGNMDRGQLVRVLSYLRAFGEQGYKANMTATSRKRFTKRTRLSYFVGRPGKGGNKFPLGVWERIDFGQAGGAVRPVLIFVQRVSYTPLLKFFEVGNRVASDTFPTELRKALAPRI